MSKIIIAVGTKRGPKLNAVREAVDVFSASLSPSTQFEIVGTEVDSGVSHTPTSCDELMRGARQRAETLVKIAHETRLNWQYFVGLEGGLDLIRETTSPILVRRPSDPPQNTRRRAFLESWAYVSDGTRGHYGRSGGIELPEPLVHEVLDNGTELAVAIDRFAGTIGVRDKQGAWGVLSNDLITRQEAFRVAVIAAFAPFYNKSMYGAAAVGAPGMAS